MFFEFPLDQCKFKTSTWHQIKKTRVYDDLFVAILPQDLTDTREAIMDTAKHDAKEYMYGVYRVILKWASGNPMETDVSSVDRK